MIRGEIAMGGRLEATARVVRSSGVWGPNARRAEKQIGLSSTVLQQAVNYLLRTMIHWWKVHRKERRAHVDGGPCGGAARRSVLTGRKQSGEGGGRSSP